MQISLHDPRYVYEISDTIVAESGSSYELADKIGSGGNSAVYECIDRTGTQYAVKFLLRFSKKSTDRFAQEIKLMKIVNHPHLIKYVDSGTVEAISLCGKNRKQVEIKFVIMEKSDNNLLDYLKKNPSIDYDVYAPQFRGLCEALSVLHQHAIHRDIKPENILIKGETWVLSDFGLCEFLAEEDHLDLTGDNEKVGPIFWMSPEAINCAYFANDEIGTFSDVFQICAVFALVLTHKHPGGIISEDDTLNTTPPIRDLIFRSMSNDKAKRPQDGAELTMQFNKATYGS